jgi:hypothetical protein
MIDVIDEFLKRSITVAQMVCEHRLIRQAAACLLIALAASGFSLKLTASTVSESLPTSSCARSRRGSSRRQGPHQESQPCRADY